MLRVLIDVETRETEDPSRDAHVRTHVRAKGLPVLSAGPDNRPLSVTGAQVREIEPWFSIGFGVVGRRSPPRGLLITNRAIRSFTTCYSLHFYFLSFCSPMFCHFVALQRDAFGGTLEPRVVGDGSRAIESLFLASLGIINANLEGECHLGRRLAACRARGRFPRREKERGSFLARRI